MDSITQKDSLGCGAACVSFIAGKNYSEIVQVLGKDKAKDTGFYCRDLVVALSKLGFFYTYHYLKPRFKKRIYTDGVIVFIKRSKKYPDGHYLARCNGQWMDPWINLCIDNNIAHAKSGFRKRLPGTPIFALFPVK